MRAFLTAMALTVAAAGCGDDESGSGGGGGGSASATTAASGTSTSGTSTSGTSTASTTTGGAGAIDVALRFSARVGDEDAACGVDYDLGMDGGTTQLEDLRFYVHDIRLVTPGGDEVPVALEQDGLWQVEDVALLDFEDGTGACANGNAPLHDTILGTAPGGDYAGLRFRVGVPAELNHADVTSSPSPLNDTTLFWDWGFGHIFLAVVTSSTPDGADDPNQHFVHVGSTGCTGDPQLDEDVTCTSPNRPEVTFDAFDVGSDVVVLDAASLLEASHLGTEIGCHSFPDTPACTAPFTALGLSYATGEETPETQAVFRAEAP